MNTVVVRFIVAIVLIIIGPTLANYTIDKRKVGVVDCKVYGPSKEVSKWYMLDIPEDVRVTRKVTDPEKLEWCDKLKRSVINWSHLWDIIQELSCYNMYYQHYLRHHYDGIIEVTFPFQMKYVTIEKDKQQVWYLYFHKILFDGLGFSKTTVSEFDYWVEETKTKNRKDYVYSMTLTANVESSNVTVEYFILKETKVVPPNINPGRFQVVAKDIQVKLHVLLKEIDPNLRFKDEKTGERIYFRVPEVKTFEYSIGSIQVTESVYPTPKDPIPDRPNEIMAYLDAGKAATMVADFLNLMQHSVHHNLLDRLKWGAINDITYSVMRADSIWSIPERMVHDLSGLSDFPAELSDEDRKEIEREVFQAASMKEFLSKNLKDIIDVMKEELGKDKEINPNALNVDFDKDIQALLDEQKKLERASQ